MQFATRIDFSGTAGDRGTRDDHLHGAMDTFITSTLSASHMRPALESMPRTSESAREAEKSEEVGKYREKAHTELNR